MTEAICERIVQISDTHLFAEKEKALLGVRPQESLEALLDLLKKDPFPPSLLILSGDLSQDGLEASYIRLASMLKNLSIPTYYVPGNHDNLEIMQKVFPRNMIFSDRHIILKNWQIILLDSHQPNEVPGFLTPKELAFLEHCLQAHSAPAIIVFHHQPVPTHSAWLDNLGLKNADQFWEILHTYSNAHTVLFGHIHQEIVGEKNGIDYYSTPSTCIQFKKNSDKFALDKVAPSYRWINLFPNSKLETGLKSLDRYIGIFKSEATGY